MAPISIEASFSNTDRTFNATANNGEYKRYYIGDKAILLFGFEDGGDAIITRKVIDPNKKVEKITPIRIIGDECKDCKIPFLDKGSQNNVANLKFTGIKSDKDSIDQSKLPSRQKLEI